MEQLCWDWAAVMGGSGVLFAYWEGSWLYSRQQSKLQQMNASDKRNFCVGVACKNLPIFSGCLLVQMYSPNHSCV